MPLDDPRPFTFVELGCGKGRTLAVAAEHGFGAVVGVALDARLSHIARANTVAVPVASVITGDAADFTLTPVPTVVFLFNPFGAATLSVVVTNLETSLKGDTETADRRPLQSHPPCRPRRQSGFRLVTTARRWAIYESAA